MTSTESHIFLDEKLEEIALLWICVTCPPESCSATWAAFWATLGGKKIHNSLGPALFLYQITLFAGEMTGI